MKTKSSFITLTQSLLGSFSMIIAVLIFGLACSPINSTSSMTFEKDRSSPDFKETVVLPAITQTPTTPPQISPLTTPQEVSENSGVAEKKLQPLTTTVETAMADEDRARPGRDNSKLDSSLNELLDAYNRGGLAEAQAYAEKHMMTIENDLVQVEIVIAEEAAVPKVKESIEGTGGEYQSHYKQLVQAMLPISALETLAAQSEVVVIRSPQPPVMIQ